MIAPPAVRAKEQTLRHELDTLGFPTAFRVVRHPSPLGLHWDSFAVIQTDQIQLSRQL